MTATRLELVTEWSIAAPQSRVWAAIADVDSWPQWWRAVKRVELVKAGDAGGVGAVRNLTWGTALPYTLTFRMEASRIEPERTLQGIASGELNGTGLWTITPEGSGTRARYDWIVDLTVPWMRAMAPVLRPVFAWNHNVVMGWGEADLRTRLGIG